MKHQGTISYLKTPICNAFNTYFLIIFLLFNLFSLNCSLESYQWMCLLQYCQRFKHKQNHFKEMFGPTITCGLSEFIAYDWYDLYDVHRSCFNALSGEKSDLSDVFHHHRLQQHSCSVSHRSAENTDWTFKSTFNVS